MVHLTFGEGVGLLGRTPIAISILRFRTFCGIMSGLGTLVTGDMAQVFLGWGFWWGPILAVASSIPITILVAIMVV